MGVGEMLDAELRHPVRRDRARRDLLGGRVGLRVPVHR
jgi:hypothetical protein